MSLRLKIASRIAGKAAAQDFDKAPGWDAFMALFGQALDSGQIRWDNWAAQRKQYKGTPYVCIRKIAPGVASAPLSLFIPDGGDKIRASKRIPIDDKTKQFLSTLAFCKATMESADKVEEITDHLALDIFKRANGAMSRYQLFDMTMVNLGLNGNAYWKLVGNQNNAVPVQIHVLSPTNTEPVVKDGITTGYRTKGKGRQWIPIKLEEMAHFWYPNPFSISQGYSPVAAGSQWISGESAIASIQNSTMRNGGIPPFMVRVKRMGQQKFDDFKKAFQELYGSLTGRGKVGFTEGDWEIEKIAQTLEELGYIEGGKMLREFIANIFGVPISKLTQESSNRAAQGVGDMEFQRDTILPNLTMIAEELNESLIPLFPSLANTGAFYMFANPVKEDERIKAVMRRVNRTTGVSTPNEERQQDGTEPHPSPEADELGPVRAAGEGSEAMATDAIDRAVDKAVDNMRSGSCGEH